MTDIENPPYTAEEYAEARQVVSNATEDIDYMGVGEQFEDKWSGEGLTNDQWDARQKRVHDLAESATVTVSWPDEEGL